MKTFGARLVVMASAASLLVSGPAVAAARTQTVDYSPWAALSAFAAPASSQALCGAAAASAAASAVAATAAQSGTPGCVFPTLDAPVPPPVAETAPLATPAAAVAGAGIGILPLLAGLAALGGLAALLLSNGDGGQDRISVSP
jgi:hypothetical protein